MIRLLVSRESGDSAVYEFNQNEILIGRVPPADVVLDNESVSRRHTRLTKVAEGWRVADLGAPNGVFLQKHGMPPAQRVIVDQLEHGDVLCIERYRIGFEVHEQDSLTPGLVGGAEKPPSFDEGGAAFTRVTTLPGFRRPGARDAPSEAAPTHVDPDGRLAASLALASGAPLQHLSRESTTQPPPGRPSLEIFEEGKPARIFSLGNAPVQFGSDATCDVRMSGLTVPRFVASLLVQGNKVVLRRVSTGLLGPKVTLDDAAVKEVELEDGQKFFVGAIAGVVRFPRGRG